MENENIYEPKWQYDIWADIKSVYPKDKEIICTVCSVKPAYAFLRTKDGIYCFLSKKNVHSQGYIIDLLDEIEEGSSLKCKVLSYDFERKNIQVALSLHYCPVKNGNWSLK